MLLFRIWKQFQWLKTTLIHFLPIACLSYVTGETASSWSVRDHALLPGSDTWTSAHVSLARAYHQAHRSSTGKDCISSHEKSMKNQWPLTVYHAWEATWRPLFSLVTLAVLWQGQMQGNQLGGHSNNPVKRWNRGVTTAALTGTHR